MTQTSPWIGGDGGPAIVVQESVLPKWNVDCGTTDYDAICGPEDGIAVIQRYDRDIIVLSDCSWVTCAVSTPSGICLVQVCGSNRTPIEIAMDLTSTACHNPLTFQNDDGCLRLMVGATIAADSTYPHHDFHLAIGMYRLDTYVTDEAYVAHLTRD